MRKGFMRLTAAAGLHVKIPNLSLNEETVGLIAAVFYQQCPLGDSFVRSDM